MGDNIWEKKAMYGIGGDYVHSGRFHNNHAIDNVKKRCPECGSYNEILSVKCIRCGFDFKNPKSNVKSKKDFKTDLKPKKIDKVEIFLINGDYLIKCPYCGWKQDWSNTSCVNCDKKFSKKFISGVSNAMFEL